jgi:flavin-dependent dehydrogenase
MKPITIIGGGLAGLSLAIALRRKNVCVTVFEAGTYPRHRVCGEFINGVTAETLKRLGIENDFSDAKRHQSSLWYLGAQPFYRNALQKPALGISRYRLDERLANRLVDLGGKLETGQRVPLKPADGLVWTAGRKSAKESNWIGLKVHVSGLMMNADLEMHLGKNGYVGLAPVERDRVNVCGLFKIQGIRGGGAALLKEYLKANNLESLAAKLDDAKCEEESFTGITAFQLGPQPVDANLCVLGDSESMIPPFTGNGMSMAFEAAETASGIIADYATGDQTWRDTVQELRTALRKRFRTRLFTARVLHPLLFSEFGRTLLATTARSGLLPFGLVSRLLR